MLPLEVLGNDITQELRCPGSIKQQDAPTAPVCEMVSLWRSLIRVVSSANIRGRRETKTLCLLVNSDARW